MALEMDHDLFMKIYNSDGVKFINKMHAHSFSQNIYPDSIDINHAYEYNNSIR